MTPRILIYKVLFTLNFLNHWNALPKGSAAETHFTPFTHSSVYQPIFYRTVEGQWLPGHVLHWGCGYAYVYASTGNQCEWLPSKCLKLHHNQT